MKFKNVALESIHLHLPDEIWTSEAIERRIESVYQKFRVSVGRLELMTGIRERRVWGADFIPSAEAANAARQVLDGSRISKQQIQLLIHCGVCRDKLEPATAAYVHGMLELDSGVQFMDLSNACLGFLNAMNVAACMIESGQIEHALLVTAETSRELIENTLRAIQEPGMSRQRMKQYFANLTIGSGAVAAILTHRRHAPESPRLVGAVTGADSSHNTLCEGGSKQGAHEMLTDSEALLHAGIALAQKNWNQFQSMLGWSDSDVNHYVCHQVGKMHQSALYEALQIDKNKDYSSYATLGNMGSAALPGTLANAWKSGRFAAGDKVALLGIGSGISSIMMGLEWQS